MEDATNEELIAVEDALPGELRQNAVIVWHDEDLGRTQGALQSGQATIDDQPMAERTGLLTCQASNSGRPR